MLSNCSINAMLPSGRPVLSCLCISCCSSDGIFSQRKSDQSSLTIESSGSTLTSLSFFRPIWDFALLQDHPSALSANPACTGLFSIYLAQASKYLSSITYEEKRPCQRWPLHPSRKFTRRVYRRCASPIASLRFSFSEGTAEKKVCCLLFSRCVIWWGKPGATTLAILAI